MVLGGAWLLGNTEVYRSAEAWSTARIASATIAGGTRWQPGSATVLVGLDTDHAVGLRIDELCSTSAIAGLTLVLTGMLLLAAGLRVHRALLGVSAMTGILIVVNTVRLTALSWSVTRWGLTGWFEWLHLYGGAAISMLAVAVGCALYLHLIRRPGPEAVRLR